MSITIRDSSRNFACNSVIHRDAKSPISGGRLPYLDVHYGLPYGRTYLPFSPFTYGASSGDRHTHAAEAAVLLLDRQVHPCLLIYAVLAQTCDVQDIARLYTWRIQVIKVKKIEICAKVIVENPPSSSLILELCLHLF